VGETIIVIASIAAFVIVCTLSARAQVRHRELLHAERLAAIERGLPPPADAEGPPPSPPQAAATAGNSLKTGLVCLGLGLGLLAALRLGGSPYWPWGLVLAGLGAAHLVYWFTLGKALWEEARRAAADRATSD
jgi:hypothetical protein